MRYLGQVFKTLEQVKDETSADPKNQSIAALQMQGDFKHLR